MIVQRNAWLVGSLSTADPNAQSFHSSNWRRPRGKRHGTHEIAVVEDNVLSFTSHPLDRYEDSSARLDLDNAISFNQTQDAFLRKVQESLQRMGELSVLAQNETRTAADQTSYTSEFTELQHRIKELESKMVDALRLFHPPIGVGLPGVDGAPAEPGEDGELSNDSLNACLDTTIDNARNASAAVSTIKTALQAVADLRVRVGSNLQRLNETGEQMVAPGEHPELDKERIQDGNGAEKSTELARYNILVQSGTAMLAQANALPQSALRLLG